MAYRVLLIEDNTDCRELFAMMVRYLGCDVLQADDGELGVQKALSEKPDLIIMDIAMPVMDGIAAIEEIMARFPTPILVLSATMDDREVNHAFTAIKKGALDVMEKPFFTGQNYGGSFEARIVEKARILAQTTRRLFANTRGIVAWAAHTEGGIGT
jgi:two-component system chemotaxis response regulator CheB